MAKGNDGNYLQHSIEILAAGYLAAADATGRVHVALAHGMGPFEPCDEPRPGQARALFQRALNDSYQPRQVNELPLVSAYRTTGATLERYPNSAELLRCAIGENNLSGGIAEIDPEKYKELTQAWSGSRVASANSSWRLQIEANGTLACPANLETPWLFSLDPMTYREDGYADDDNVYRADLDRLSAVLRQFVSSGKPGLACIFVYAVRPEVRRKFWGFIDDLANRTGTTGVSCWLTHQGGNRNLAGLLCATIELPSDFLPVGLRLGRD